MWKKLLKLFVKEVDELDKYKDLPKLDEGQECTIDSSRLRGLLKHHLGNDMVITIPDLRYYLPPVSHITDVLKINEVDKRKYTKESGDCDDYAFLLKALFTKLYWGKELPIAFGIIHVSGHALNIFMDRAENLYILEPQADTFTPIANNKKKIHMIYI